MASPFHNYNWFKKKNQLKAAIFCIILFEYCHLNIALITGACCSRDYRETSCDKNLLTNRTDKDNFVCLSPKKLYRNGAVGA
jgi:hypothetical protein